jgi:hypothetical protein
MPLWHRLQELNAVLSYIKKKKNDHLFLVSLSRVIQFEFDRFSLPAKYYNQANIIPF